MTERKTVILLLLAAIVSRALLFVVFSDDLIVGSDQADYINLGRAFASGNLSGVLDTYWPPFFPVLLGLAYTVMDGLLMPAIAIAILAGSLAVPAIYYFVRQSYGRGEALIAGVLALFYPHLLNSVFAIGSENVYLLLITGCLITGWKAITADSVLHYALTGALVGLAYLTRPEAFAYPAYFVGIVLFKNAWRGEQFLNRSIRYCGVFLIAFLVLAAPYLMYLKRETGKWTVSAKTEVNMVTGDYDKLAAPNEDGVAEPTFSVETGVVLLKLLGLNLLDINRALPYLIPLGVMLFMSLGLFSSGWGPSRLKRESYLIIFCLLTVFGYAATVVQTRYFYILLPIFLGWAAKGICSFAGWFRSTADRLNGSPRLRSISAYAPAICLLLLFVYLLPLNFFMRSAEASGDRPFEERAAGLWLRANAGPGARVFSARKVSPFYGQVIQVPPRSTDFESVFESIQSGDVDFVVVGKRDLSRNPFLKDLESRMQSSPKFERVYTNTEYPGYPISIFKRKDSQTISPQP